MFNSLQDKIMYSDLSSQIQKGEKNVKWGKKGCSRVENENGGFREKVSDFSLDLRQIRPLAVFETRRKNVLHRAGYAWNPDL